MGTPLFNVTGPPGATLSTVLCLIPGPSPANKVKGVIFQWGPPVLRSESGHPVQYVKLRGPINHLGPEAVWKARWTRPVSQPTPRSGLGHWGSHGDSGPLSVGKVNLLATSRVFRSPMWPGHFCLCCGCVSSPGLISPCVTRSPCWRPSNKAHFRHPVLLPEAA